MPDYTQGRIRVSRTGAHITRWALLDLQDNLLTLHREARGRADQRKLINADIREVRRVLDEVDRTIEERGWEEDDEPLRSHSA